MADIIITNTFAAPVDLTVHTSTDASPLQDYIVLFVRGDFTANSHVRILLQGAAAVDNAFFTVPLLNKAQPSSTLGLASVLEVNNAVFDLLGRDRFAGLSDQERLLDRITEKNWIIPTNDWQFLVIPKRIFKVNGAFSYASVNSFQFSAQRIVAGEICISDLLLVGGGRDNGGAPSTPPGGNGSGTQGGLQGTYKYKLTFLNSTTGNRSNGSAATQVAEDVNRGYVALSSIPVSSDPQVSHVEIWRTVGNGDRFFKIGQVTDGTTTFDDEVSDHDTLDSTTGTAVMTTLELPIDNARPQADFDQVIIDKLTAFWITNTAGNQGRVFFSPIGRPESFKGFIDVTKSGDPLHRLIVLNGQRFVFSESRVYRIDGDDPYITREIGGVPGVQFVSRRTVVATPFGIVYQAPDGIRQFNGSTSQLINFDPVGKLFRGETVEGIPAFEGTVATFARGEYFVSNGSRTLAVSLTDLSWRDVGYNDVTSFNYEWDTDKIVAGRVANTQLIEEEGTVTDAGSTIPFEWETPAVDFPNDKVLIVERVFTDVFTDSVAVTAALINRFTTITLGTINNTARETNEFVVNQLVLKPSLRFSGSANARVTVFDAELDIEPLEMGVNVFEGNRIVIDGRYREELSADGSIVFKVPRQVADFDQTNKVFVIDRVTIEANTGSQVVTPIITLKNTAVTLATINTSTRIVTEIELDRIGPVNEFRLDGPFFNATPVQIFRVELHVRELVLGINDVDSGRRGGQPARAIDSETAITFEINPSFRQLDDYGSLATIERVVFDIDTVGVAFTPSITTRDGGTISPTAITQTGRASVERRIDRIGPIETLTLSGDFIGNAARLFGVELYIRPLLLGINLTTNNQSRSGADRLEIRGRAVDPTTLIEFEVQPSNQTFNMHDGLFWIERMVIEYDNDSGSSITATIETETGTTITVGTLATTTRTTEEFIIQRPGPPKLIQLSGDFSADVKIYSVELYVRPVELGIQFRPGGDRLSHDGRLIDTTNTLSFVVDPSRRELDGVTNVPLVEFIHIDVDSNSNAIVVSLIGEAGTVFLTSFTSTTRETVIFPVNRVMNLREVKLEADFTTAIELYGVELAMRALPLDISVLDGG